MSSDLIIDSGWRAQFGPFTLSPSVRLLEREGVPIRLGGRALDILVALVESAGEVVGKKDLLARVWPDMIVEEGSLRVHMVAIRKALGDGGGINRYIVNIANKGYTFVARVTRETLATAIQIAQPARPALAKSPPALASAVVGREAEVGALVSFLLQRRFVTVVGTGGIGKTTTAMAVVRSAFQHFAGDVHFIDLSTIAGAGLAGATVASAVGLLHSPGDAQALQAYLAERRCLIVLDCCEHVIDEAAALAEALVQACPQVHVLATSRESLRATGEFVYRLQPLAFPQEGQGMTAASALEFPAVRLFVERAEATSAGFQLTDRDAAAVSRLCRELDGLALAIELAAGRIEALGLEGITSHLDASATLLWHGRRTAVARHRTLGATLDWSFNLLPEDEKRVLRRLSVFAGSFSLDAGLDVCCADVGRYVGIELIANLVSKSLVTVDAGGAALRYGMYDTTKSYCRTKLHAAGENESMLQRLAQHFGAWAPQGGLQGEEEHDAIGLELANLRAALDWYFRDGEQMPGATELAATLCPMLMQLSQVAECSRWAQAALAGMSPALVGSPSELRLQGVLGQSLTFSGAGDRGKAAAAYRRGIEVAELLGDRRSALHLLNGYAVLLHREGRYTEALDTAYKAQLLLNELDDMESRAIVDSLMGVCLHMVGKVGEAMQHWEHCFAYSPSVSHSLRSKLGFDYHIRALCGMARSYWFGGQYNKAVDVADDAIAKAQDHGHAVTYCIALIWAGSVYTYGKDSERMAFVANELERVGKCHSLDPYPHVANVTRGQLLIAQGRPAEGVERIRSAVDMLHVYGYEMVTSEALMAMAMGLSDLAQHPASLALCDEVEKRIQAGGDFMRMPELLITRGRCLSAAGRPDEAANNYIAAIELARTQGMKSGEVRAAVALAQTLTGTGQHETALSLLRPHVAAGQGEASTDLSLARDLLA